MLVELIYASQSIETMSLTDVRSILEVSAKNNTPQNVTGALLYNSRYFLQWLEGERMAVCDTYHRIAADPRHKNAIILSFSETSQREFSNWSMGYLGEGLLNRNLFLKYSTSSSFNPYEMTGESARAFMLELYVNTRKLKVTTPEE